MTMSERDFNEAVQIMINAWVFGAPYRRTMKDFLGYIPNEKQMSAIFEVAHRKYEAIGEE